MTSAEEEGVKESIRVLGSRAAFDITEPRERSGRGQGPAMAADSKVAMAVKDFVVPMTCNQTLLCSRLEGTWLLFCVGSRNVLPFWWWPYNINFWGVASEDVRLTVEDGSTSGG